MNNTIQTNLEMRTYKPEDLQNQYPDKNNTKIKSRIKKMSVSITPIKITLYLKYLKNYQSYYQKIFQCLNFNKKNKLLCNPRKNKSKILN